AIAARFSLVHLLIVIGSFHFVNHAPNPREVISAAKDKILLTKDKLMAAVTKESPTDISLYARYALAGTFCCAFTHAVLTPVDVVIDKRELLLISITGINLGARLVAGLAAAVVSQPADMMLSRINKERAVIGESISCRLVYIASELRLRSAYTGMQIFRATDGVELSERYVAVDSYSEELQQAAA
ncbi:hypothetical protein H9L39_11177, partial [Fusarium oxysporum f. sp. albedinis]